MQTIYATTTKFVHRDGNVVDFTDYLRRMKTLEQTDARADFVPARPRTDKRRVRPLPFAFFPMELVLSAAILVTAAVFAFSFLTF